MIDKPLVSVVIPTHNRKEKLIRLIRSIQESTYKNLEIIVIDDASTDGTYNIIKNIFPKIEIMRNQKELLVSASRNIGIRNSKGDFIFLIDDDNIVDRHAITELVNTLISDNNIGVVGPIMYYHSQPNMIWCAGIKRNMFTSKTNAKYRDQADRGQFDKITESDDFPNSFMINSKVLKRSGIFDEKNFPIHYEESDFCQRIKNEGYKIILNPFARVWHDITVAYDKKESLKYFHIDNKLRAYYTGRNRVIFHKKYSKWWQYLIFIIFFNWIFTAYYLSIILNSKKKFEEKSKLANAYLEGVFSGLMSDLVKYSRPTYDIVIISRYNPFEKGGLEGVARKQIISFVDNGLKVATCFRRRYRVEKNSMIDTITISDSISKFSGTIADIIYSVPFYMKISKINTRIILDNFEFPIIYKIFKTFRNRAILIKVHHGTPNYLYSYSGFKGIFARIYSVFYRISYNASSKMVDLNVAVSDKVKQELIKDCHIPTEKIIVINNGVNIEKFKPMDKIVARKMLDLPYDKKIILFIGNDLERKGFSTVINIVKFLRNTEMIDTCLVIVTSTKSMDKIKNIDKEWLKIFTNVPENKMPLIYNSSDILLLPSKYEGLSLTILEALASGCPAVVSPGSIDYRYNGEGCIIAHDFNEYIVYCKKILDHYEYRKEMSFKGRKLAISEYDENKQYDSYYKLILKMLKN